MKLDDSLLQEIKVFLDITWQDEATDKKLKGIALRGMEYLEKIAGMPLDFMGEGEAKRLLLNFCLYSRGGADDEFEKNYKSQLVGLRLEGEVAHAKKKQED